MAELLALATDGVEQMYLDALAEGSCGQWLLDSLKSSDRLTEPLVRAAAEGRLQQAAIALSLPLVAQNRNGELDGALLTLPPGQLVKTVQDAGLEHHDLLAMMKYAKLKALAVPEHARGQGVGAALLKGCMRAYWQLDFMLLYGSFEVERKLGPYYTRHGFTVLAPGETTDVGYVLSGRPIHLGTGPDEQLFFRWNL